MGVGVGVWIERVRKRGKGGWGKVMIRYKSVHDSGGNNRGGGE